MHILCPRLRVTEGVDHLDGLWVRPLDSLSGLLLGSERLKQLNKGGAQTLELSPESTEEHRAECLP